MPKNLLQDMVKAKHVRNGTSPDLARQGIKQPEIKEVKKRHRGGSRHALWVVAIISIVFFLFALSYLLGDATVTVNPKVQDLVLNENLSASLDKSQNGLPFDLVVISGEETNTVQATEQKDLSIKAQGVVLLYNNFSKSAQRLDVDTRLEGSNGKIYKTATKTVVPGMTVDGKPGSVEVKIYGSVAGPEYNSAPLDFKILGFKGTPKYSKFYGRSKGEITGGLTGKFPVISDSERASVFAGMKTVLQTKLFKKATDQIPNGFILFKDAVFLSTDEGNIDTTSSEVNMLPVKLKGTLYGLIFDEEKLSKKIAADKIEKYDGSSVYIANIRDLTFSLTSPLADKYNVSFANSLSDVKNINFNLKGETKIVWKIDVDKLTEDLLGKSKKDFSKILLQYPNIESANLVLNPIWEMSIPDKAKDIKIIVNYPK